MPSLSFEHVSKRFGEASVVEDFNLRVEDGELLVLVGGSGSGKSTILRMVAGLEPVTSGSIYIDGRDITHLAPRDRDVAMVFQDYALYPHMTVRDNLSLGLRFRKVPKHEIERRVRWAAALLGLDAFLERKPKQLSGGQRQRVAMGRAMVREPLVFLFDEPLSNLDAGLRARMRVEIGTLQRRLKTTTVYVTHDQVEAMTLGDRIVVLANGRIEQVGRPLDLYRSPVNRFVAGFFGTPPMNFIDGRLHTQDGRVEFIAEGLRLQLEREPLPRDLPAEPVTLGVRPEHVVLTREPASADGTAPAQFGHVVLVERLGGTSHIHLDIGPHRVLASISSEQLPEAGDTIGVQLPSTGAHLFLPDGRSIDLIRPVDSPLANGPGPT